jgi:hypothetical protein
MKFPLNGSSMMQKIQARYERFCEGGIETSDVSHFYNWSIFTKSKSVFDSLILTSC